MDRSDAEIVDGLRRADPAAFDAAFERYHRRVWAFLLRLGRRTELADELLQETFLRLAAHGRRLREDTVLRAWLFTVARNLWRSHQRWAWLDGQRLAELASRAAGVSPPSPLEVASASEVGRQVERALAALPETLREVAWLVLVERLEPAEVAPILGIRPDAVRQRLARARQQIAEVLDSGAGAARAAGGAR